jgi:hypothetical protein
VRHDLDHCGDRQASGRKWHDPIPFLEQGYRSAVRFTEPNEDFDHQHQDVRVDETGRVFGDLLEFVDFEYVARVTRVNGAALAALATAPVAPRNVRVQGGLSYDTNLRWTPNTEPHLAAYEVVWRQTGAPDWTHTISVGNPEPIGGLIRVSVPMSKDNFFFGVRAVGTDGSRSPVVFPRP